MSNFEKELMSAKGIWELGNILNDHMDKNTITSVFNTLNNISLPTFRGNDKKTTIDIYSWDQNSILIFDYAIGHFRTITRCKCGEAPWYCICPRDRTFYVETREVLSDRVEKFTFAIVAKDSKKVAEVVGKFIINENSRSTVIINNFDDEWHSYPLVKVVKGELIGTPCHSWFFTKTDKV